MTVDDSLICKKKEMSYKIKNMQSDTLKKFLIYSDIFFRIS